MENKIPANNIPSPPEALWMDRENTFFLSFLNIAHYFISISKQRQQSLLTPINKYFLCTALQGIISLSFSPLSTVFHRRSYYHFNNMLQNTNHIISKTQLIWCLSNEYLLLLMMDLYVAFTYL